MNAIRLDNLDLSAVADRLLQDVRSAATPGDTKGGADAARRLAETDSGRAVTGFAAAFTKTYREEKQRVTEAKQKRRVATKERLAARIRTLEQSAPDPESEKDLDEGSYAATGRVTDAAGQPLSGVRVRAWDRDIRFDDDLGEDVTGIAGRYRIEFGPEDFAESGENQPEVYVTVVNAAGEVVETSPKWSLSRERNVYTIDVKVDAKTIPGVVETGDFHTRLANRQIQNLTRRNEDLTRRLS